MPPVPGEGAHPARGPPWSLAAPTFRRRPAQSHARPPCLQTAWSQSSPGRARAAGTTSTVRAGPCGRARPLPRASPRTFTLPRSGRGMGAAGGGDTGRAPPEAPALSQGSLEPVSQGPLPSRPAHRAGLGVAELGFEPGAGRPPQPHPPFQGNAIWGLRLLPPGFCVWAFSAVGVFLPGVQG